MQKIVPHLWFDREAVEAAKFYTSVFPDSNIKNINKLSNTPSGDVDTVIFEVMGYKLMAISAGPLFKFNPSISLMVNFDPSKDKDAGKHLDEAWKKLSDGGKALMPLDKYPFSERYGWIQDKYGFSWQLILTDPTGEERPTIIPAMLFVTNSGKIAEEATDFYLSVFKDTKRGIIARYGAEAEPNQADALMFTDFMLEKQWFAAMDGLSEMHKFAFNEAVSMMVYCNTQEEIDYYWNKLSAVPEYEQCGWLKDKYGLSWQIVPYALDDMMSQGTKEQIDRVTQAFLKMKKFDLKELEKAYNEK